MRSRDLFEILIREHADLLTVYLRAAVSDRTVVDDLFQETLLVAWRRLDTFDKSRPFGPWLRGIAAKLVLSHYRRSKKDPTLVDHRDLEHLNARCEELHQQIGDTLEEKLETLRECIASLPSTFREVVELRYLQELRGRTLADRLEITIESSKKRLQRARSQLMDCMERKAVGVPR